MKKKHRNSQKRVYFEDTIYFVTCKTESGHPFFKEKIFCDLFVENLRICKKLKGFYLYGWVLVYNHFHLLVRPNDEFNISKVMFSIKKQISHNINIILGHNKPYIHPEGAQSIARLRGTDEPTTNEMIEKFDQYILKFQKQFHIKHPSKNPYPRFQWHKSFHDHYIRNDSDFDYHMEYIIWNPQKHKLPDNWTYVFTNPIYEDLVDDSF